MLGNIIGSIPATYYAKAQCILYASPPAPDTGSPRAAYSNWATVQQAADTHTRARARTHTL